ncbi:MAG: phosphoglycerate dehydrogenase, partial [Lautropia mirabilis]|nr:phosphoglycerate dehydrogenase [Lautropia mirabilis]
IGTQLGLLAETLGMRVVFYDIETKLPLGNARQLSTLDELLAEADVVSLHVPETPDTKNMMGAEQIARMKKGSFLINASRGTVVDIDALAAALESKHILGAAIDVFPVEPKGNEGDFQSPLIRFENVLLTPHIGGSTGEAQESIGREVASKLIRYSNNGSTLSAVNFPEVSLPAHPGLCRILHIHRNVPGMLTRINERLSNAGINIASQYLQTNQHVGYVVVDVENEGSAEALHEISDLEGTIRARVLY